MKCCIAPGCKNDFYKVKAKGKIVNFHKLQRNWKTVLQRWLVALKRKSPPMGTDSRVCSEHFLEEDYTEEIFDSGKLVVRNLKLLRLISISLPMTWAPLTAQHTQTTGGQRHQCAVGIGL